MANFPIDVVLDPGKAISGGRRVEESLNRISNASDRMRGQMDRNINQLTNRFSLLESTAGRLTATLAGVFAGIKVTSLIKEVTALYQSFNQADIVMQQVGKNAGYTAKQIDEVANSVRKSGISMIESRNTVTKLASANIDLSNATKLARLAQDAAVIGQINSSEALERLIHGITSAQVEVLRGIGLNVNFEQSYKKLADTLGKNTDQLTEAEKAQARLNVAFEAGTGIAGAYEASLDSAGKMYGSTARLVEDLKVKVGALFDATAMFAVTAYTEALKDTNKAIDVMVESGELQAWGDAIARTLAFIIDGFRSFIITVDLVGKKLGSLAAKTEAFFKGDFKSIRIIDDEFGKDFDAGIDSMSKMRDLVEAQIISRNMLTKVTERNTIATKEENKEADKTNELVKAQVSEQKKYIDALKKEAQQAGLTANEVKRLEAARLGVSEQAERYIKIIEDREIAERQAADSLDAYKRNMDDAVSITESVMTASERYAEALANLDRLYAQGSGPLGVEAYNRKVKQLQEEFVKAQNSSKEFVDDSNQFMIQGARNIQSAFADFLFDPFDKGLKGMVTGVANAVRRMIAEFAAMKILQGSGVGRFLGMGSMGGVGGKSSGGGIVSGATSMLSSGMGIMNMMGEMGSMFSGSAGAFMSGMGGGTIAGVSSPAALAGSSFASVAGPVMGAAIAAALSVAIGSKIAGDKKVLGSSGTTSSLIGLALGGPFGAILGGAVNALFGRGPLKQGMTVLDGMVGSEGFESGGIRTRFDAKGGMFRSNKTDFAGVDAITGQITTDNSKLREYAESISEASSEIIGVINDTVISISTDLFGMAENMNLSTEGLDNFSTRIKVVSEAGKFLDEAEIAEEVSRISNELVKSLVPAIEELGRGGETAIQTIGRLNGEFNALVGAAHVLSGSLSAAQAAIQAMSFEARTNLVDSAGGIEALTQKIGFFSTNFLSDQERLAISQDALRIELGKVGIAADISRQEFTRLIKSVTEAGGVSTDMAIALLNIAPLFHEVATAMEANVDTGDQLVKVETDINALRQQLIQSYKTEQTELQGTISRFGNLADSLRSFRNDLALGDLSPLTPGQRLDEARTQFNRIRALASQGDEQAMNDLPEVARNFLQASQTYNASSAAYISDFNLVMSVLENAERTAMTEKQIAQSQLTQLEKTVGELVDLNENVITVDTSIKALTAAVLQGPGNAGVSNQQLVQLLSQSGGQLTPDLINNLVKTGVSADQFSAATGTPLDAISRATGGLSVSDQQIKGYVDANISNPMQIYNAAIQWGIASQRLSSASGIPLATIQQFVRDNNLAMFQQGTDFVPRDGIAMLHKGEAVVPSGVAKETQELRKELAELRRDVNRQTDAIVNVIIESNRENAEMIADSAKNIESIKNWNEQSKVDIK